MSMATLKITKLVPIATATIAATLALPATAHASLSDLFQSPSANIGCAMVRLNDGTASASCDITEYDFATPDNCPNSAERNQGNSFVRFVLHQGKQAQIECPSGHTDAVGGYSERTLDYGQTSSVGTITCDSGPSGITCTDSSTGHFVRVSRESYQLG
jgi:hypothetical protein